MSIKRYGVVAIVPHPDDWKRYPGTDSTPEERIAAAMSCRFLVIRRSSTVLAPDTLCFAGGGIEAGESSEVAIRREYREELDLNIRVVREIWQMVTPWDVHLRWFLAELLPGSEIHPAPAEVSEVMWMSIQELQQRKDFLVSNLPFFEKIASGEILL